MGLSEVGTEATCFSVAGPVLVGLVHALIVVDDVILLGDRFSRLSIPRVDRLSSTTCNLIAMTFRAISPDEFEQFCSSTPERRFQTQSPEFFRAYRALGREAELVGFVNDDGVRAAALIRYTPWRKFFRVAKIAYGPILDWNDEALSRSFMTGLVAYLKSRRKVLQLTFNPILARNFYAEGELVPSSSNPAVDSFEALVSDMGARRETREFYEDPAIDPRFIYTKSIDGQTFDEALPTLAKGLRRRFRQEGRYGVEVVMEGPEKWHVFKDLHDLTVDRTGMSEYSSSMHKTYQAFMQAFGEDEAALGIAYLRPRIYLYQLANERAELEGRKSLLLERKATKNRDRELEQIEARFPHLDAQVAEAEAVLEAHGERVAINSAVGFYVDRELILVLGAMDKRFQGFLRDYPVERAFFKEACDRGLATYNTFGVSGIWDETAPDAPVLQFKQLLNGQVEEFVGTYHVPIQPRLARIAGL